MKIALSAHKGVQILSVSDSLAEHDTKVLRAGLTQIFRTGKNQIILELPRNLDLASEVIRAIADFDILARELSGRIVLAQVSTQLKTKIEVFAKPPVILCFETREQALEFFSRPPAPEAAPTGAAADPATAAQAAEIAAAHEEREQLKKRIKELELLAQQLKEQVVATAIQRRPPSDEAFYLEKIQQLEAKVTQLLGEVAAAAPPKPAPA